MHFYWHTLYYNAWKVSKYWKNHGLKKGTLICYWYTRGTPRVQFANIRKMVLCQGLPHCLRLYVDPCMARHAKSQLKSMLNRKIWKLFRPPGNGRKRTKCDQFFCPKSDFFNFCNPCFFYHTFTNDVDFVDKAYAEICDHSSFTLQFR